jgi:transcriptional regulator with XRE-family HTH domain
MLSNHVVHMIRELLEAGFSQRQVEKLTLVSRGRIADIALGRRPDYEQIRRQRENEARGPSGAPRRCPHCGSLVYLPCVGCRARRARAAWHAAGRPRREERGGPVRLELDNQHRQRYERIRRRGNWSGRQQSGPRE